MHRLLKPAAAAFLAAVMLAFPGCPPAWTPPFDTTGEYTGAWSAAADEAPEKEGCPIFLELVQEDTPRSSLRAIVSGIAEFDLRCIDPRFAASGEAGCIDTTRLIELEGEVFGEKSLKLDSAVLPESCEKPVCLEFGLIGAGDDTDNDGFMDVFDGVWTLTVTAGDLPGDCRARFGEEPFPWILSGTFVLEETEAG
jgi:hypothetical protein